MKYIISAVLGIVIVTVGMSLWLIGSPGTVRKERMDELRVQHLQEIESSIYSYWQSKRQMPSSLDDLTRHGIGRVITDPETGAPYEYRSGDTTTTFQLCATFLTSSTESMPNYAYPMYYGPSGAAPEYWNHPTGNHCFDRVFDPALLLPVVETPVR